MTAAHLLANENILCACVWGECDYPHVVKYVHKISQRTRVIAINFPLNQIKSIFLATFLKVKQITAIK